MPGFNGKGPLTGKGCGFCILKNSEKNTHQVQGFAGLQDVPVGQKIENNSEDSRKAVISMPRGDRTGPAGAGPMTGRSAGFCAGYQAPGYANSVGGRGFRGRGRGFWGRGGGRGWRNWFNATGLPGWLRAGFSRQPTPVDKKQELAGLKQQEELLQNNLSQINERIEQLEK
jgi:hypothetical protein